MKKVNKRFLIASIASLAMITATTAIAASCKKDTGKANEKDIVDPKQNNIVNKDDNEKFDGLVIDSSNLQQYIDNGIIVRPKGPDGAMSHILKKPINGVTSIKWMLPGTLNLGAKTNIISLYLPKLILSLEEHTNDITACETLKTIYAPNLKAIVGGYNYPNLQNVIMPNIKFISSGAFLRTPFLANLISSNPDKLAIVNGILFNGTQAAGNLKIPQNVKQISANAFNPKIYGSHQDSTISYPALTELKSVTIPNICELGEAAFSGCEKLEFIDMPNVFNVPVDTFWGCESLSRVNLPNAYNVYNGAFGKCKSLTTINLPKVEIVGWKAFDSCINLTDINMSNAKTIFNSAFKGCSSLTNINLENVIEIDQSVFADCVSLQNIELPKVTRIYDEAFKGCKNLKYVGAPFANVIGSNVFSETLFEKQLMNDNKLIIF
ncbi:leucine-rich repeat domain-containing protein [Ureaplasma miroungigenitalium]|uniref:Leucine-rich repeat domain-containing protein n=1 Tax=Ureaplasma miroungigenitalium TaxID=1042321 RepID=A0ABT3BMG8_9BACT|nr:leucine-rich repeat domain-containing protein [Ureaplasma miroungigenitalium]MCV3728332.1 leucine-rich repeat domain-containing protein [Ureaplasma miroungigenitalium]